MGADVKVHGVEVQEQGSNEEKIFVSVRLRPLDEKENVSDWECINKNTIVFKHDMPERAMFPVAYTFDRVFGDECPTREVYQEGVKEIALSVLNGINSTIFAYGQTSSGKTYTMSGITEYAVTDIYDYIEKHQDEREYVLKFSAIEIYNEAVRDLLSSDCTALRLLDDPDRGTIVERLTEEILEDKEYLEELLSICEDQRRIGETSLNETSSRSHQILRLTVESSARDYSGAQNSSTLTASVNFVDLAGSERASQTLSVGGRLKEGCHINRSLLALGTVIRKLSKGRNGQHVPYRDSKLTRILQNSLGGNGRTAIICTMSPARSHFEQSKNTLFFASCAKEVKNNALVNLVRSDKALVKQLQRELAKLENEMKSLGSGSGRGGSASLLKEKEMQIEQMAKEIEELTRERDLAQSRVENLLKSVEKAQPPNQKELMEMETSKLSKYRSFAAFNELKNFDEPDTPGYMKCLELSANPEDYFLLDDSTPKFAGPDPWEGWEGTARKSDEESKDFCKDVRCIKIEEPSIKTETKEYTASLAPPEKEEALTMAEDIIKTSKAGEQKEGSIVTKTEADEFSTFPEKEEKSPAATEAVQDSKPVSQMEDITNQMNRDESYDALRQKIQELQKAVYILANLQAGELSSTSSDTSSCFSRSISRSRSCRSVITTASPPLCTPERLEAFFQKLFSLKLDSPSRNTSRRYSQSGNPLDACSLKGSDVEDIASLDDFVPDKKGKSKLRNLLDHNRRRKRTSSLDSAKRGHRMMLPSNKQSGEDMDDQCLDGSVRKRTLFSLDFDPGMSQINSIDNLVQETAGRADESLESIKETTELASPSEFEIQRRKIIELWDACYAPLIHRTYFFLLFKGDPSDAVYMEVELRRLSFLKNSFPSGANSKNDIRNVTLTSSMKDLNRERTMLSKQISKKYGRKEREELYKKWGIELNTKKRALQLARSLWTDTVDMKHIKESAALVAKLIEFVEPSQAPKEVFGLSFLPKSKSRRSYSYSWR